MGGRSRRERPITPRTDRSTARLSLIIWLPGVASHHHCAVDPDPRLRGSKRFDELLWGATTSMASVQPYL